MRTATLAFSLAIVSPFCADAQSTRNSGERDRPVVVATRVQGSIVVDGRLDESAWADAVAATGFTQVDPEEGQPVSERTEARILYDDEALYIGVRLFDRQRPTSRLGRRDMPLLDSDWLGVVIDSYHDHRTGFSLDLNPAGVQRDAVKSMGANGHEHDDLSWDAVWDAKATVDEGGWTAEYRVPFSQLRFGDEEEPVWGIQLERVIGRRREYAVFSFTPKSEAGGIPNYGHLEGLRGVEPGNRLEVLPYAVARLERVDPGANPFRTDSERFGSGGVDLLYRVTSDFTVNASINPGAPSGPIDRIASGGELSRFLLALKVCLAARSPGLAMIFDEIDRGVGGATADAVGRRLALLAKGAQVLVVTHSPQVAACGTHHWQITKTTDGASTWTNVVPLDPDLRIDEIARMLAGEVITPEARSAARVLMEDAG